VSAYLREAGAGRRLLAAAALGAAFAAAVVLRSVIGGSGAAQSPRAGLVFAVCLTSLTVAAGTRLTVTWRDLRIGIGGAALICGPAAIGHLVAHAPMHGFGGFGDWAPVVAVVAVAEEYFLRGAFYDALAALAGPVAAVTGSAAAFAALHVPLYGWPSVPLDLAVGLVLGVLRLRSGSAAAPAIAHTGADFGAWLLR
jgi:membrane protease YdiL (CAAX protease family)